MGGWYAGCAERRIMATAGRSQVGVLYHMDNGYERGMRMAELPVTLILPSGGTQTAEVPDDVSVRDLLPELVASLALPTTGPDGRPMSYRVDSKALGRELQEAETLQAAGVPEGDRLLVTADITAGSSVADSPRMRRL